MRQRAKRRVVRGPLNERCAQAIRDYWAHKGKHVHVEVVYENGMAVVRSDLVNGLPQEDWCARVLGETS
jgi:hypothetical protein